MRASHKNTPAAVKNTFLSATELSMFIDGEVGHDAAKASRLINGKWVEFAKFVIGPVCILDLLDFLYRADDGFAVDNAANSIDRQVSLLLWPTMNGWNGSGCCAAGMVSYQGFDSDQACQSFPRSPKQA